MAEAKKTISADTHLKALALFTMGQKLYAQAAQFETAMGDLLGVDDYGYCGCISDEMHEENGRFDRGFKKEGYEVKIPSKKK